MRSKSAAYALAIVLSSSILSSCSQRLILEDVPKNFPEISKRIPTLTKHMAEIHKDISNMADQNSAGSQIWFVKSNAGQMHLVGVKRNLIGNKVESAVRALIEGPSKEEGEKGLGSEIPRGTLLLGVEEKDGGIEVNLSRRFASDGGTDSFETRMNQLSKTVSAVENTQPIYLNIEGHRLTMTQGEGIEVKQPINR